MKNELIRETKLAELMLLALEMETDIYEAAYYTLSDHYVAAGFRSEQVEAELSAKTKEELLELYYDL